jgi:hypothetical protein
MTLRASVVVRDPCVTTYRTFRSRVWQPPGMIEPSTCLRCATSRSPRPGTYGPRHETGRLDCLSSRRRGTMDRWGPRSEFVTKNDPQKVSNIRNYKHKSGPRWPSSIGEVWPREPTRLSRAPVGLRGDAHVSVRPRPGRKLPAALACGGHSWHARAAAQPGLQRHRRPVSAVGYLAHARAAWEERKAERHLVRLAGDDTLLVPAAAVSRGRATCPGSGAGASRRTRSRPRGGRPWSCS